MQKKPIDLLYHLTLLTFIMTFFACQNEGVRKPEFIADENDTENVVDQMKFEDVYDSTSGSIPIFYNMYLTVDMSSMIQETGVEFRSSLLNASENLDNYLTSYKKALNIGVYAVDLSYVKLFDEFDFAGKYFSAMHKLSEGLGIPDEYFYDAAKRFEKNIGNRDSLAYIANEIYTITDEYLKENGRANTAALVVVGGWIEAMYLAVNMYELSDQDSGILDKIADQRYSLNQVVGLVDTSEDKNEFIIGLLNNIKDMEPDLNSLSSIYDNTVKAQKYLDKLKDKVTDIRKEIIN